MDYGYKIHEIHVIQLIQAKPYQIHVKSKSAFLLMKVDQEDPTMVVGNRKSILPKPADIALRLRNGEESDTQKTSVEPRLVNEEATTFEESIPNLTKKARTTLN